jgi:NADH-quinone oxidoreductase subunit M
MVQRVLLGPLNEKWKDIPEINARELVTIIPLVLITIAIGVYPLILLKLINPTMTELIVKIGGSIR